MHRLLLPCLRPKPFLRSGQALKSDGHIKRVKAKNNKFFVMLHTKEKVSMRMFKQLMWEAFPGCGIAGMVLRMNPAYFILQAVVITAHHVPEENIRFSLATELGSRVVDQRSMYDIRMTPVGVYVLPDLDTWTLYCYQLSMTDTLNDGVTRVSIAYGHGDRVDELVSRPSFSTFVQVARNITIPGVIHPSQHIADGSSLVLPHAQPKVEMEDRTG